MCYPVCGTLHIKKTLLLIGKSSPCSVGSGFPLSLSGYFFTICLTLYNHKQNVLSVSLNKPFHSLPFYYRAITWKHSSEYLREVNTGIMWTQQKHHEKCRSPLWDLRQNLILWTPQRNHGKCRSSLWALRQNLILWIQQRHHGKCRSSLWDLRQI